MIRFYAPDIAQNGVLPESDSQHAVRVLRMREGDELFAVDGRGSAMRCRIVEAHPKRTAVEIIETLCETLPWQQQLAVAVAPTKHLDRMEWLVEKLTEIGVNRIISIDDSPIKICVVTTDEEMRIARETDNLVSQMH